MKIQLAEMVKWLAEQTERTRDRIPEGAEVDNGGGGDGEGAERAGAVDGGGNCHGGGGMLLSCYETQKMALKIHFLKKT